MKVLFVADGRSPIALNWIQYFLGAGYEVHLASTFPCEAPLPFASFSIVPVAFSSLKARRSGAGKRGRAAELLWGAPALRSRTVLRQLLGPLTLNRAAGDLRAIIAEVKPDLVHAMRIPYEGMLASVAMNASARSGRSGLDRQAGMTNPPLLISVWGNDFSLHATSNPWMARFTRQSLQRASALHTDCRRDLRTAHERGFSEEKPAAVLPGGGGVQLDLFYPPDRDKPEEAHSLRSRTVINPRGFRAYVRNETFFRAIPIVLESRPETRFLCPEMSGERQVLGWIQDLGIESSVELLPPLSREQMAERFRQAAVTVSPTVHDGTPNTLLEAMACGCFPVAGDLESIREWISTGVNGLLVDPTDPQELAGAILSALTQPGLRAGAAEHNLKMIRERAEYGGVMRSAEQFYREIVTV
jgi:glycosyltransferase involved in cell wall biosynthesis